MKHRIQNIFLRLVTVLVLIFITRCDLVAGGIYVDEDTGAVHFSFEIDTRQEHPGANRDNFGYQSNRQEEERREAEQKIQLELHAEASRKFVRETEERAAQERADRERREREHEELMHRIKEDQDRKRKAEQEAQVKREQEARQAAERARVEKEAQDNARRAQELRDAQKAEQEAQAKRDQEAREATEKARAEKEAQDKREQENSDAEQAKQDEYSEMQEFEVDASHIPQGLHNFNEIFTGLQAPDMESFNNLMSSFLGKGSSSELDSSTTASFDLNIAGDYILSSFKYQDDKAGVFMEIARVMKVDDCQTSLQDDGLTWDNLSSDTLILSSIRVFEQNREVTLAFYREGEKILLQSDLTSMSNFVAQRNIEGIIFFDPTAANRIPVDLNNIPTHGLKNSEPTFARQAASIIVDFIPLVGTTKAISELIFGYDHISGENVHRVVAGFGVVASFVPIPGAAKAGKFVGKAIVMTTELLAKKTDGVIEKNIARLVKSLPVEAPEALKRFKPQYESVKAFSEAGYKGASKYYVLVEDRILHAGDIIKRLKPDIQEQLRYMRIPEKPLVPGGGLLKHEMHPNAHTIEKHVGKSDEYLQERSKDAANSAKKPDGFSTFNNIEEAEYFVAETIGKNSDKVTKWLENIEQTTGSFELKFAETTGRLLKEGESSAVNVDKVRVVLMKDSNSALGYTVLTAFPIDKLKNG